MKRLQRPTTIFLQWRNETRILPIVLTFREMGASGRRSFGAFGTQSTLRHAMLAVDSSSFFRWCDIRRERPLDSCPVRKEIDMHFATPQGTASSLLRDWLLPAALKSRLCAMVIPVALVVFLGSLGGLVCGAGAGVRAIAAFE